MLRGANVAGIAYYLLLLLGLVSFGARFGKWSGGRLLLWIGFAALSATNTQLFPFFAVVAGPITALNFQDWIAERSVARL